MAAAAPQLNRASLRRSMRVLALRTPVTLCQQVIRRFREYTFAPATKKFRSVQPDFASEAHRKPPTKLVLLSESVRSLDDLPENLRTFISSTPELAASPLVPYDVELSYEQLSYEQVLRELLPESIVIPTGFETVGHVAHVNLSEEQRPYGRLIGQVLLDKKGRLRTVVNKVSSISNEFRVSEMEVLAGDDDLNVELREHGCRFRFDFSRVYWNSKLQTEHARIVSSLSSSDVVCDMMCGVGPFAIPAAKRGITVFANDLNPDSYAALVANKKLNKIPDGRLHCHNLDAREFFRAMRARQLEGEIPHFDHVIMNLPATAIEFLDVFRGAFSKEAPPPRLPRIHCYCFASHGPHIAESPQESVLRRVFAALGASSEDFAGTDEPNVRYVRDVAPSKDMYCCEFTLPEAVAFAPPAPLAANDESNGRPLKKTRVS